MIIGYARLSAVSDLDTLDTMRQALIEAGAETVYLDTDATSGQDGGNAAGRLAAAIAAIRPGDVLLTLTPTLTATSIDNLIAIADKLTGVGASLRVQRIAGNQTLDTATPAGAMLLSALGLLAAFTPPGSAPVQTAYASMGMQALPENFAPRRSRGRPPTASTQAGEIARMRDAGMRATDIADRLKICRASVYRVLNMANTAMPHPLPAIQDARVMAVMPV